MNVPLRFYNAAIKLLALVERDVATTAGYPGATANAANVLRLIVTEMADEPAEEKAR